MRTWFKLYRGWQDSPMFRNNADKLNWLWLLEHAVYKDTHTISINNSPFVLKRGQLSYSIRYLAQAWGTTPSYARTFLKHLKKWQAIDTQNRTGQTLITICNYSQYQDGCTENRTPPVENMTSLSHSARTNNKKVKKVKKDNKNIIEAGAPEKKACRLSIFLQNEFEGDSIPQDWGDWVFDNLSLTEDQINFEWAKFLDYWNGVGGQKGCKLDWQATWRNWCRRKHEEIKRKEELNDIYSKK